LAELKELAGVADLAEQSEMAGLAVLKERQSGLRRQIR
jgi:hypothetical protein